MKSRVANYCSFVGYPRPWVSPNRSRILSDPYRELCSRFACDDTVPRETVRRHGFSNDAMNNSARVRVHAEYLQRAHGKIEIRGPRGLSRGVGTKKKSTRRAASVLFAYSSKVFHYTPEKPDRPRRSFRTVFDSTGRLRRFNGT